MLDSAFELGKEIDNKKVLYKLHQPMWIKYDFDEVDLQLNNWTTIKYLNNDASGFHDDIENIPNDSGGLYLFSIKCPIIPGMTDYPAYLGRAKLTDRQNLRKRCREYFNKWYRNDERPKITRMIKFWGKDLYLSFMELEDNNDIDNYEGQLINSLLLPFNDKIPDKEIQQAINAFQP